MAVASSVTVGIISFNVKEKLRECIDSLHLFIKDWPIFVWDNGSTDGTKEMIQSDYPDVKLYHCSENLFFARGCNELISRCDSTYTLLMNADIKVIDSSCRKIADYMDKQPKVIAASPSISDNGLLRHMSSGIITPLQCIARDSIWGILMRKGKSYQTCMEKDRKPNEIFITRKITNCCCLIRRNEFLQLGGFSTRQILYWTEEDFAVRCFRNGWLQCAYGKSIVEHDHGSSTKKLPGSFVRALYVYDRIVYMSALFGYPAAFMVEVALIRPRLWKSYSEYKQFIAYRKDIVAIEKTVREYSTELLI